MKAIFEQLGFDEQSIKPVLARIKARHDKSVAMPDYMDTVRQYRKEIESLQKAVKALDAAINGLSVSTRLQVQDALPHFMAGIQAMPGDISVNYGAGPNNQTPSQKTQVKGKFVLDVAQAYRRQTGNEPTIITGYRTGGNEGPFIEFLLACADELCIDSKGLDSRAKKLREGGEI